jgi:hypothetical protein
VNFIYKRKPKNYYEIIKLNDITKHFKIISNKIYIKIGEKIFYLFLSIYHVFILRRLLLKFDPYIRINICKSSKFKYQHKCNHNRNLDRIYSLIYIYTSSKYYFSRNNISRKLQHLYRQQLYRLNQSNSKY